MIGLTMIVCLCKGVSDGEICDAIRRGACSIDEVSRRCRGAGGDCGSCRSDIVAQIIDSAGQRAA